MAERALRLAQVGMVSTAADTEGLTGESEVYERLLAMEGMNEDETVPSGWATMAKAFFQMSF